MPVKIQKYITLEDTARIMPTVKGPAKRRVLVVGAGGVGTMACVALERSGKASVTAVLRSNYEKVIRDGFEIESVDHGKLSAWRPSQGTLESEPSQKNPD